jgi:hypothetical protein
MGIESGLNLLLGLIDIFGTRSEYFVAGVANCR